MSALATASTNTVLVGPQGALYTTGDGAPLMSDTFDGGTIDTAMRWNAPVVAGGGTVTQSGGSLVLASGTTASNAAALSSQQQYVRQGLGWLRFGAGVVLETTPVKNNHRFLGVGTPNASFTSSTPLADAVGFEVDVIGSLIASIYNTNVRVFSQNLPYPVDGIPHSYRMDIRDDVCLWFIDNMEIPVAGTRWISPATNTLPVRFHTINGTVGPSSAPTFVVYGFGLADTSGCTPVALTGQVLDRQRSPWKFVNVNALSIATETTVWTPASGKRFRLMGFVLTSGTIAGNVVLKDNTAGTTIMVIPFGVAAGTIVSPPMGNGIISALANNVLTATGTATQTLSGFFFGTEE